MEGKDSCFNKWCWGNWSLAFRDGETNSTRLAGHQGIVWTSLFPPDLASAHPLPDVQQSRNQARGVHQVILTLPLSRGSQRPAWLSETETTCWAQGWEGSCVLPNEWEGRIEQPMSEVQGSTVLVGNVLS